MKSLKTKRLSNVLFPVLAILMVGIGVASCDGGGAGSQKSAHDDRGTEPHTH